MWLESGLERQRHYDAFGVEEGGAMGYCCAKLQYGSPKFEKMIGKFMDMIGNHLYILFVASMANQFPMECLKAEGRLFKHHPSAFYALNVHFQQTNKPTENHAKSELFFSGKHHLYGVKAEVAVNPVGLAMHVSGTAKGSVANKKIATDNLNTHKKLSKKSIGGLLVEDEGRLREIYPNHWAIILDKGYQGQLEFL